MSSIIMSEEFLAKAKSCNSFEELKALVSAEGVEVADSELMGAWERISESAGKGKFKLSMEELDDVAGGCGEELVPHETNANWAICGFYNKWTDEFAGNTDDRCALCSHFQQYGFKSTDTAGYCS